MYNLKYYKQCRTMLIIVKSKFFFEKCLIFDLSFFSFCAVSSPTHARIAAAPPTSWDRIAKFGERESVVGRTRWWNLEAFTAAAAPSSSSTKAKPSKEQSEQEHPSPKKKVPTVDRGPWLASISFRWLIFRGRFITKGKRPPNHLKAVNHRSNLETQIEEVRLEKFHFFKDMII